MALKYRRLSLGELEEMKSEFIRFLAANTVTGDDWQKIKTETPEKAEQLIEMFSDIVFEKILDGVKYLEVKSPQDFKTFHCKEDKILLLGLRVNGDSAIDFTQNQSPADMIDMVKKSGTQLQLYQAEKGYKPDRRAELFRMIENGALISQDGEMFLLLESLKV